MATYQGVGISFGTGTVTGTGVTGKIQTRDFTKNAEVLTIKDDDGVTVARVFSDPTQDATFEYVVTGDNSTTAQAKCTIADPGSFVTVTGTGGATAISGTWSVESGIKISHSNDGAARITLPLKKFPSVTATVS